MQRRKLLAGMGSLAAGAAAGIGTGAFSFMQTDRDISLEVTNDANAYLRLALGNENDEYATYNNGKIEFSFDGSDGTNGDGMNPDSVYLFDDIARIENQGSQEVALSVPDTTSDGFWSTNFVAYVGDGTGSNHNRMSIWPKDGNTSNFDDLLNDRTNVGSLGDLIDTGPDQVTLGVGDWKKFGVAIAATDEGASKSTGITLRAEETP